MVIKAPSHNTSTSKRNTLADIARSVRYNAEWRKLRKVQLATFPLCMTCIGDERLVAATDVHHKVDVADDPALRLDMTNLVSLCHSCHSKITRARQLRK